MNYGYNRRRQRGFVLIASALVLVMLFAFLGLVVDVGMMRYWKRRAQNAADAAAIGALQEVNMSGSGADYGTAGQNAAVENGFTNGQGGVTVQVNMPPTMGAYAGIKQYAEAIVTKPVPTTFLSILNIASATVSARSTATAQASDVCIYAMQGSGDGTFSVSGSAVFDNSCGVGVNSTGGKALSVGGSACLAASSASVVGNYNGVVSQSCNPKTGSISVNTGVAALTDPFASVPAPSVGACNQTNFSSGSSQTIYPGVYCGGIKLTGGTLTVSPGMYILNGGGLTVNAGTTMNGTGVTFYNTSSSGHAYKQVTLNGSATIVLKAPVSGTYESILFFNDRSTASNVTASNISGNNSSVIEGTLYFPSVTVQFTGNSSLAAYTIAVANKVNVTGNTNFNNDYSSLTSGSPLRTKGAVTAE